MERIFSIDGATDLETDQNELTPMERFEADTVVLGL
jgi:hypothetical protein